MIRTITFDDEQWRLVPRAATDEMLKLILTPASGYASGRDYTTAVWSAILAASPPEPPMPT